VAEAVAHGGGMENCCLTMDGGLALAYPLRLLMLEPSREDRKLCGTRPGNAVLFYFSYSRRTGLVSR
jgi:hypothetical protein